MKNRILPFILILSFILPLFVGFFSFDIYAADSVSSDVIDEFVEQTREKLGQSGYVIDPAFYNDDEGISIDNVKYTIYSLTCDKLGLSYNQTTRAKEVLFNYANEHDLTVEYLLNSIYFDLHQFVNDNLPYYVYRTIPIDKFFSFYDFSNYSGVSSTLGNYKAALESLCNDSDNIYFLNHTNSSTFNYLYETDLLSVSSNYLENYGLVLYSGSFSIFPSLPFQSVLIRTGQTTPSYSLNGFLKFYNGLNFADTSSLDIWRTRSKNGGNDFQDFVKLGPISSLGPVPSDFSLCKILTTWPLTRRFPE